MFYMPGFRDYNTVSIARQGLLWVEKPVNFLGLFLVLLYGIVCALFYSQLVILETMANYGL